MPRTMLPLPDGFYTSDSRVLASQECINWYLNVPQAGALNTASLFGTPGINQQTTTGPRSEANRGSEVMAGVFYFVNGTSLYKLASDMVTHTLLGTIAGTERVSMVSNGTQLCILATDGATSTGYIFTTDPDTLVTITDGDFTANGVPQSVAYIDSYFLFTTDSKKFIISALNDGLAYNALDFGTAESNPDDITGAVVFRNQLYVCGATTIEAFQNVGGADFPFQRTGLFIDKGVKARDSLIVSNSTFLFVGGGENESAAVWAMDGNTPIKVSTTAIDVLLEALTADEIAAIFAWSYAAKGAYFVGFTLPDTTIVFDTITGKWHERKSRVTDELGNVTVGRWRVNSLSLAYGHLIVGDYLDGRIGILDNDLYMEYGKPIFRRFATQPFQNDMLSLFIRNIELTMESGVGNADSPDPVIRMEYSDDGGRTWQFERTRRIGKIGAFGRRTIWKRNGRTPRYRGWRFTLTDFVKPAVLQLTADIEGGKK